MRKVTRFIDSVGYFEAAHTCNAKYRLWSNFSASWGSWIGGSPAQRFANCALTRPTQNGSIINGWRMPTGWAVLAGRTTYGDFDYQCLRASTGARYNFAGHGSDPAHGLPKRGGVSVTGGNMTVNLNGFLVEKARLNARLKIQDLKVDIGVMLAESMKTFDHLVSVVERLLRLIHAVRNYDWKSAWRIANNVRKTRNWSWPFQRGLASTKRFGRYQGRKIPKRFGDAWLEYQYAWLPLISDIYGLQELLKSQIDADNLIFQVSSVASDVFPMDQFYVPPTTETQYSVSGEGFEQFIKVVYNLKVSAPRLRAVGMGVTNPAALIWELTPFSFVLDWVYPIGSFFQGLTATQGTAFVSGFEDRIISGGYTFRANRYGLLSGKPVTFEYEQFAFERLVKSGVEFALPYIRSPFSTSKAATAVSLLTQLRR